jgi:hypothetical protein
MGNSHLEDLLFRQVCGADQLDQSSRPIRPADTRRQTGRPGLHTQTCSAGHSERPAHTDRQYTIYLSENQRVRNLAPPPRKPTP